MLTQLQSVGCLYQKLMRKTEMTMASSLRNNF